MHNDAEYNRTIEQAEPIPDTDLPRFEKDIGFTYKQGIGELIYAMVTCRPDISFALIKLAQYSARPAKQHFTALKGIYAYLKNTRNEGIHYWRTKPRMDCPLIENPETLTDYNNYNPDASKSTVAPDVADLHVESSYGADRTH